MNVCFDLPADISFLLTAVIQNITADNLLYENAKSSSFLYRFIRDLQQYNSVGTIAHFLVDPSKMSALRAPLFSSWVQY